MAEVYIDDEEVLNNLRMLNEGGILKSALESCLEKACLKVEAAAKSGCPAGGTGTLRNSITHRVENMGELAGYVGTNLDYAPYVHQGTGIYAKNGVGRKQVPWVYRSEKDGQFYSTKGIQPTPFLKDAVEDNRNEILRCFRNVIAEMAGKI